MKKERGIPFVAVFSRGGERNARLAYAEAQRALNNPKTKPEDRAHMQALHTELARYLADPFAAAAADQAQLLAEADSHTNPGKGRKRGARNKSASRIDAVFDKLLRENPDCTSEDIRTLKAPKSVMSMGKSTVARHWSNAKKRAGK